MNYRDYIQVLCKSGHCFELLSCDNNDFFPEHRPPWWAENREFPLWRCPLCEEHAVWYNNLGCNEFVKLELIKTESGVIQFFKLPPKNVGNHKGDF